ncbi:DUF6318 family protein [Nocardioides sp. YIM 152588]|uniref:DUF6318 family protein n=1 Tax=Nocardioides sp. YIM 152588 TaxID=3158259 RepID=UPI0032E4F4FA
MPRRPTTAALVAAATLLVGACAAEADPAPTPPSASAAPPPSTATPDPGPVEPTLPAAATRNGKAGAEAFVEYYWEVVSYAQASGDTTRLEDLHAEACSLCTGAVQWIDRIYGSGGHINGGKHTVLTASATPSPSGSGRWVVASEIHATATRVAGAPGRNGRYDKADMAVTQILEHTGTSWRVHSWSNR